MKILVFIFSIMLGSHFVHAETATQKIDRSANEAVEEVKTAGKIIINKLKKNTNSEKDPEPETSKKKVQKE